MKNLSEFSILEILKLKPLKIFLKELRNDWVLFFYKKISADNEGKFILDSLKCRGKNVICVVAFEQPKVLEWLFTLSLKNTQDFYFLVFDNSKNLKTRKDIQDVCERFQIPYLSLPQNPTRHPNRSHGMALTWIFYRIIKKIQPAWFGFLDHDMIPVKKMGANHLLSDMWCYGLFAGKESVWNLWAGYCFFNFQKVGHLPLNFLYDFSRNLDTGGRNWNCLYSKINITDNNFPQDADLVFSNQIGETQRIQLIDDRWVHIASVSYNENMSRKSNFYENLVLRLLRNEPFDEVILSMFSEIGFVKVNESK